MLYIRQTACISPQKTIFHKSYETIASAVDGKLTAQEPSYENIPPNILRRMGKAVRMGVGAALQLFDNNTTQPIDGIIIGTANGGIDESMKFLQQIVEYNEGVLSPGSFVQGLPNAIAAQLGLLFKNRGYNSTHVHKGLAFENALIDAYMQLRQHPGNTYIAGAVEEISLPYFNVDLLKGNCKIQSVESKNFYGYDTSSYVAGEGAAMFLVSDNSEKAIAEITGIDTVHTDNIDTLKQRLENFIEKHTAKNEKIDLFLSGENGAQRYLPFYSVAEQILGADTPVIRCKHLCGEYSTASSYALWLSCQIFRRRVIPFHLLKTGTAPSEIKRILIYNTYDTDQHGFLLVKKTD